jgi:hypothetical protein
MIYKILHRKLNIDNCYDISLFLFLLSCLGPLAYLRPMAFTFLAFQYFDYERPETPHTHTH